MFRYLSFAVAVSFSLPAQAQDALPEDVRRALFALDDRALDADRYEREVFEGYEGPSVRESQRALGHAAALTEASERVMAALRAASMDDEADDLAENLRLMREEMCPELAESEWSLLSSAAGRARMIPLCQTSSYLIHALRTYAEAPEGLIRELAPRFPTDCDLARRALGVRVENAARFANAELMRAISDIGQRAEDRRATVEDLRADARRPDEAHTQPDSHDFAPALVQRYYDALRAMSQATDAHARAQAEREVADAARALASSADPRVAERELLRRAQHSLDEARRALAGGANHRAVVRSIEGARGYETLDDELPPLIAEANAIAARCPR
jgi:hypothetical protein